MDSKLNDSLPYISNNRSSVNSMSCLQPQHAQQMVMKTTEDMKFESFSS